MTRIFTDGAEMGDILFADSWYGSNPPTILSPGYASTYYYNQTGTGTSRYFAHHISAISECYTRLRVKCYSAGSILSGYTLGFYDSLTSTLIAYLAFDGSNHMTANISGVVGTSSLIMSTNRWYLLEVYYKEADNPDGRFVVYIDGIKEIDYTGDTKPGAGTTFDQIRYFASTGSSDYDDLALNDTDNSDGKNDNSWCGDRVVVKITPSGSGTVNNWLNSGSVSGSANYLYVDDFPHDSDSSYTYFSGSMAGTQDKYKMSTFSGTNKLITRIFPEVRARKSVADLTTMKIGYLPSEGTDQLSGSITLTISYARYVGTSASANPVSGSAWTEADINAIQFVAEI